MVLPGLIDMFTSIKEPTPQKIDELSQRALSGGVTLFCLNTPEHIPYKELQQSVQVIFSFLFLFLFLFFK